MNDSFSLPPELQLLIATGVWPNSDNELRQNLKPVVSVDAIQKFASDEDGLYLHPPPFYTVAVCAMRNSFWGEHAAPSQLDFTSALVLGDFGLGSDAPIVLDYSNDRDNPSVKRLQWRSDGNRWVEVCETFAEFAALLEMTPT
jgi:hypothetical protein